MTRSICVGMTAASQVFLCQKLVCVCVCVFVFWGSLAQSYTVMTCTLESNFVAPRFVHAPT